MTYQWKDGEEWQDQDGTNMMFQDAHGALAMLAAAKAPSIMHVDGGYICSKSIYPAVKRTHKKVTTYDNLLKKVKQFEMNLKDFLQLKACLNVESNTLTIG